MSNERELQDAYDRFTRIALEGYYSGMKRWSARGIFHVLRWQTATRTGGDTFKINNNHSAAFAERAMKEYPGLKGFFEVRRREV